MIVAGIDVGSITAEAVILKNGDILGSVIMPTGASSKAAADRVLDEALHKVGLSPKDLKYIVATGYGRISASPAHKRVTEITCHGRGAFFLFPSARTVIDIGGQDSKVIRLGPEGQVVDFAMNEKCAAGTGRFLEVMARALEVELEDLAVLSRKATRSVPISSICTVFAESEVVSLIATGQPRENIIRGIHDSIAERTAGLLNRVGIEEDVVMTGGVANNSGVVEAIEERIGIRLNIPERPDIIGALGAALIAADHAK
ncbi:MAG: 2-hydroxyglutaryl-CoA dehydratase [Firmicutes bacterium]|nr:2-hydroxyglutaryl-CoA dehydratase [Bacillota bacterium]